MVEHGRKQASKLPPSQPAAEERLDDDLPDDVAKKFLATVRPSGVDREGFGPTIAHLAETFLSVALDHG